MPETEIANNQTDKPPLDTGHLPTEQEYTAEINNLEKTFLGSVFPISKKEAPRVLLATLTYFFVSLCYSFLRQFKDIVIYDLLTPSAAYWLKIIVFFASFSVINTISGIFNKNGINKGTDKYIFYMASGFLGYSLLVFVKDFICPMGWAEEVLLGHKFTLRKLGILATLLPMVNHFIMVMYYVFAEVLGSALMSYVFMTYFGNNLTPFQMGRYIRPVYIGANCSLLCTGFLVSALVKTGNKKIPMKYKFAFYGGAYIGIALLLLLIYVMKRLLDREFAKELYQGAATQKKGKKKGKTSVSMLDSIKMVFRSKLLFNMVIMSLGYNFATACGSSIALFVYTAYAEYLKMNPAANKTPGFIPTRSTIGMQFKSLETTYVSVLVIFLMLTPMFMGLFKKFGVFLFALITMITCVVPSFVSAILAAINYPFTNYNEGIMFGLKINASEPVFKLEATAAALGNVAIKIGKYAFYDIVKENVSVRIDPADRALYKGIFDGVAAKGGKMLGSLYSIFAQQIFGHQDARWFSPLTALILAAIGIVWFFSILQLHSNYNYAERNKCYLQDSHSRKKKEIELTKK